MVRVRLYTKAECSLCEDAREIVYRAKNQFHLEVEEIDIRSSTQLFAEHRYQVPVLEIDVFTRLTLRFTWEELLEVLR